MVRGRLLLLAVLVLLAAGCGGGEGAVDVTPSPTAEPQPEEPEETPSPSPTPQGDPTVTVAESAIGPVIADAEGRTVYAFTEDPPGESTCTQYCIENWPPLLVDGAPIAGTGVDEALLGVIEREDGNRQVAYAQQALYYFAGDEDAAGTGGHGVNGAWFAVALDGDLIPAD